MSYVCAGAVKGEDERKRLGSADEVGGVDMAWRRPGTLTDAKRPKHTQLCLLPLFCLARIE